MKMVFWIHTVRMLLGTLVTLAHQPVARIRGLRAFVMRKLFLQSLELLKVVQLQMVIGLRSAVTMTSRSMERQVA